jgi:predicted TIM-barrel fold metal-dependent hydrolase
LTKTAVPGLEEAFATIAELPLVNFDTALVPSAEIVVMALKIVGTDRIMYGSDEPLNLIRSVPYMHPQRGERLATEYPYHWVNAVDYQSYKHLAAGVTHSHWSALRAIKAAVATFPQKERDRMKQNIFCENAKVFYGFGSHSRGAKK